MGELAVARGNALITTGGIGSCLAIIAYDPESKVGGMAHAMLPQRNPEPNAEVLDRIVGRYDKRSLDSKYVDEAIYKLVQEVEMTGAKKENLEIKLVGGARMFQSLSKYKNGGVGQENLEVAKKTLAKLKLPIRSQDVGGNIGKIVKFNLNNGLVRIITKI